MNASSIDWARTRLGGLGLLGTDVPAPAASDKRFADGGQCRVEIPSVEGPAAMRVVLARAAELGVPVHRVSQGSGGMMLSADELDEMVTVGREHGTEICLFVGPRAAWDVGAQVLSVGGAAAGGALRGADQLAFGLADVMRMCDHGVRSVLVADLGALWTLAQLKRAGDLPSDLVLKVSVALPAANPATARVLEDLGASTINVPGDLTVAQIAGIRAAIDVPVDVYVESPDDLGGFVRHYETPALVRYGAPVYLKFGLRNAPGIYPAGGHIEALVLSTAAERVRRASIGLEVLRREYPDARMSPLSASAGGGSSR